MTEPSRAFQVFVKPAGPACNLRCSYCYYLGKKELYPRTPAFRMSYEVLEQYTASHFEATKEETVFFSWHGGEPLLAGIGFYRKAVDLQKKYSNGRPVLNGIQTNGTLLDDEWCRFLKKEGFIVGISIDGPERLHNAHRFDQKGKGSFNQVIRGLQLLQEYGIPFEILCVVHSDNVNFPLEIYHFFKQTGARTITFLPLVQPVPDSAGEVTPESVAPGPFGHFLTTIFDEWVENDIGKIDIQIFEEAIRTAFNREHTLCIFKVACGGVPVVEHNGDVYSCDHYVDREHLLGNLKDQPLSYFLDCERQKNFGRAKVLTLPRYCRECPVLTMCNGECPKNRFISTPDGESGLNVLCEGYRMFFTHIRPFVEAVREMAGNAT